MFERKNCIKDNFCELYYREIEPILISLLPNLTKLITLELDVLWKQTVALKFDKNSLTKN